MSKNPFLNALAATAYITLIVSVIFYGPQTLIPGDSIIVPITMLSLFVLSAALMGYFFVYGPVQLLIEGKQKEAMRLFLLTVASFAGVTLAVFASWLLLSAIL